MLSGESDTLCVIKALGKKSKTSRNNLKYCMYQAVGGRGALWLMDAPGFDKKNVWNKK